MESKSNLILSSPVIEGEKPQSSGFKNFKQFDEFIQNSLNKFQLVDKPETMTLENENDTIFIISFKSSIPDLVIWNKTFNKNLCFLGSDTEKNNPFPRFQFYLHLKNNQNKDKDNSKKNKKKDNKQDKKSNKPNKSEPPTKKESSKKTLKLSDNPPTKKDTKKKQIGILNDTNSKKEDDKSKQQDTPQTNSTSNIINPNELNDEEMFKLFSEMDINFTQQKEVIPTSDEPPQQTDNKSKDIMTYYMPSPFVQNQESEPKLPPPKPNPAIPIDLSPKDEDDGLIKINNIFQSDLGNFNEFNEEENIIGQEDQFNKIFVPPLDVYNTNPTPPETNNNEKLNSVETLFSQNMDNPLNNYFNEPSQETKKDKDKSTFQKPKGNNPSKIPEMPRLNLNKSKQDNSLNPYFNPPSQPLEKKINNQNFNYIPDIDVNQEEQYQSPFNHKYNQNKNQPHQMDNKMKNMNPFGNLGFPGVPNMPQQQQQEPKKKKGKNPNKKKQKKKGHQQQQDPNMNMNMNMNMLFNNQMNPMKMPHNNQNKKNFRNNFNQKNQMNMKKQQEQYQQQFLYQQQMQFINYMTLINKYMDKKNWVIVVENGMVIMTFTSKEIFKYLMKNATEKGNISNILVTNIDRTICINGAQLFNLLTIYFKQNTNFPMMFNEENPNEGPNVIPIENNNENYESSQKLKINTFNNGAAFSFRDNYDNKQTKTEGGNSFREINNSNNNNLNNNSGNNSSKSNSNKPTESAFSFRENLENIAQKTNEGAISFRDHNINLKPNEVFSFRENSNNTNSGNNKSNGGAINFRENNFDMGNIMQNQNSQTNSSSNQASSNNQMNNNNNTNSNPNPNVNNNNNNNNNMNNLNVNNNNNEDTFNFQHNFEKGGDDMFNFQKTFEKQPNTKINEEVFNIRANNEDNMNFQNNFDKFEKGNNDDGFNFQMNFREDNQYEPNFETNFEMPKNNEEMFNIQRNEFDGGFNMNKNVFEGAFSIPKNDYEGGLNMNKNPLEGAFSKNDLDLGFQKGEPDGGFNIHNNEFYMHNNDFNMHNNEFNMQNNELNMQNNDFNMQNNVFNMNPKEESKSPTNNPLNMNFDDILQNIGNNTNNTKSTNVNTINNNVINISNPLD